jgi:hypothetical protein
MHQLKVPVSALPGCGTRHSAGAQPD